MDYSKILRNFRKKKFLTQMELAILLGVSFSTVNRWENRKNEPTMKQKRIINEMIVDKSKV